MGWGFLKGDRGYMQEANQSFMLSCLAKTRGSKITMKKEIRGTGRPSSHTVPCGRKRRNKHVKVSRKRVRFKVHFLPKYSRRMTQHSRAGTARMLGTTCTK